MLDKNNFHPDWASPPGDTISDILQERNLSLLDFAQRMNLTPEHTDKLLHGRAAIANEIAERLGVVLGASAAFWMTREYQYREDVARLQHELHDTGSGEWLSELPVKEMIEFGWLEPFRESANEVKACLRFFGVPNVGAWREKYRDVLEMAAFRTSRSFNSRLGAVAAWLRQGELSSASLDCNSWESNRFQEMLLNIRPLTREKDPSHFIPELVKHCAGCGVAVVIVRAPTGCRASGATRFISQDKALLLLSFRHLSDDHFWFTFFHEAGHLLLHGKQALFLEGANMVSNKQEEEANEFAAHLLIPPKFQTTLFKLGANGREVIKFARLVGVSPGIIVGQLQHLGLIKRDQLNNLKRRFTWVSD